MIKFDDTLKKILDEIQKDFPLCLNPYQKIAQTCGISEQETIEKLKYLTDNNIIREISVILKADKLGYQSTLVAVKTENQELDKIVKIINEHPGVSHNYLRNFDYNIWFTLTIKKEKQFSDELETIFSGINVDKYLILPSIRTFKIGVNFSFLNNNDTILQENKITFDEKQLTKIDKQVINLLQGNMKLVSDPWEKIIDDLKISPERLFIIINELKAAGIIKRISGVLRHRNAGFKANGMACFKISDATIESAGKTAAEFSEVSHCYQRPTYPEWPYSLFCMVHSENKDKCNEIIKNISDKIKCNDYIVLYSEKEFKKERIKFTLE